ncbi:enoyl-CoA hydratase/isomerase family protein [Ramlibacter henchirensis]|uniref:Enoyl-CoA hydratase/isomerase family protein n=1 Tax=Ramlibacter henchirensis TaxID=204072 RepID=A0A4Z0BTF0_9BURK|nr:enoyl-CoA hydratase/isomerase family protein [Ramlibacter henchirensis]TFZ02566.1 enoyl-CoA hydratase/isomerase family protein [Ramlibacter henchirensis]
MDSELRVQVQGGIARLTLDRPHKRNSMTPAMRSAFTQHLNEWAADPSVRLLLLEGAGPDFCAGSDMSLAGQQSARERLAMFTTLARFPKPVVASVQGACIGAAVAMVACCDAVLASPSAFFSVPEVRLGFPPGALAPLLLRGLGERGYRRYVLSGERFDARTAQALGLVHEVCEDLGGRTAEVCAEFLRAAPGAAAAAKKVAGDDVASAVEALIEAEAALLQTEDAREGLAAARERRRPSWDR